MDEEMSEKLGQEPAFACECMSSNGNDGHIQEGMSKRFYAACAAMQGMLSSGKFAEGVAYNPAITELSYKIADELLKQENE